MKHSFSAPFLRRAAALGLPLCLAGLGQAASIIVVTDDPTRDTDLIDYLSSQGHSVTNGEYKSLDSNAGDVAELNSADMVLVSRNTNSGDYANNADEVAAWDSLTASILLGNAYISRNNRWSYVDTDAIQTNYGFDMSAPPGTSEIHPFFSGLTPNEDHLDGGAGSPPISGLEKYRFSTSSDLPDGGGVMGDGLTIGVRNNEDFQNVILASWDAGDMTGSGNTLGGDRYFYAIPEDFVNFEENGVQILDNITSTAIPEPAVATLLLPALLGILGRRRM